jgi:hypothetical protein
LVTSRYRRSTARANRRKRPAGAADATGASFDPASPPASAAGDPESGATGAVVDGGKPGGITGEPLTGALMSSQRVRAISRSSNPVASPRGSGWVGRELMTRMSWP